MSDVAIRVEHLSKAYQIGGQQNGESRFGYRALRDVLADGVRSIGRRFLRTDDGDGGKSAEQTLWALNDVNFEVQQGEVLGIIGRNGAGKSTLLKILSRITEPTKGQVTLRGRVGSLLEVGTGFHPELTGRENIYLNGAILGMKRAEIVRQFDAIVAFAEVERFLDTPVKHYSSGMYMRLAFAVAAHLEPEILLVDEVLAVGDAQFQKKCLGKMENVAKEGRTVLFVSHNMAAMRSLCEKGVLLEAGSVGYMGNIGDCIQRYLTQDVQGAGAIVTHLTDCHPAIELQTVTINGSSRDEIHLTHETRRLRIEMRGQLAKPMRLEIEARIYDLYETPLAFFGPGHQYGETHVCPAGEFSLTRTMELPEIMQGQYRMTLYLAHPGLNVWVTIPNAVKLFVEGPVTSIEMRRDYYQGAGWVFLPDVGNDD